MQEWNVPLYTWLDWAINLVLIVSKGKEVTVAKQPASAPLQKCNVFVWSWIKGSKRSLIKIYT